MQAYRENYPNNLIVIVGNKHNWGDKYAQFVADHGLVTKVCVLKGGIDAYRLEYPQLLRKAKNNQQTENDFLI
jgi:3-mercaptopyruvate sulfurtransferase SseA